MRRVALGLAAGLLAVAALPARADCGAEIRAVRAALPKVKQAARRQELELLLEKAAKDEKAGRARLCEEALKHARILLK